MKIERLLAITVLLLNRRRVTAGELAERFEVSARTIYRDIQTLNGAGIPVVSSQGHEGGIAIPENYKLSRQLLTLGDMLSILSMLKGVNQTLQNADVDQVIEKITALIPEDQEEKYHKHIDSFVIDITPWGMQSRIAETLKVAHAAISDSILLDFVYTDSNGQKSRRSVEPHTLLYKNFGWYLLAYCRLRSDFRIFRLSRIRDVVTSHEHFARKSCPDPETFMARKERPQVTLKLRFAKEVRIKVEDHFDEHQLSYEKDGSVLATFELPEDDWILSFLLSFGSDVEVLSPLCWRERIQKKCMEIEKLYSNMT